MIMAADGVGGWNKKGICPGVFTKLLTKLVGAMYEEGHAERNLKEILAEANRQNPHQGSCTAVLTSLTEDNTMKGCNLGDSGYAIFRPEPAGQEILNSQGHIVGKTSGNTSIKVFRTLEQ